MSGPLATALTMLAGFTLYAAIHSLFNAYYRPQRRMHVYFALMCTFGCFYIFARLNNFHSHSVADFIFAQRFAFLAAQLFFLSQIEFITEYAQWRPRWIVTALVSLMLVLVIVNIFLPYGLMSSSLPTLQQFTLPWGETITDTRIHDKTLWWYLQWVGFTCVFMFQFAAAFRLRKFGDIQRGNALLWFGGIFFAAMLFNLLINFYVVHFTQVAEFGLIAMIIMMSLHLNREARDTRQRAESAEGMWSSLVMNAPNFILLIDTAGIIQFINHVLPVDDIESVIGKHVDEYLHADSRLIMRDGLQKVISSKEVLRIQLQLGEPRNIWLDAQLAPLLVGDKLEHIIVIATDVTEQIAIKNKLQQSEAKYRQLLQTLPYGVQEVDRLGNITFSNPAHDRLFGYPHEQMLGKSVFELPPGEEEADRLRNYLTNVFARHMAPETYYKQIKRQSGEVLQIKIDWDYKYDEQGNVIGLISVLSDITQQQQALMALKDSEEKFRQLAENIKQLFYIRDLASNRMLYVSPAYETIWGRSLKRIYDDPADFINNIHPDDKPRVLQLVSQQNQYGQLFDAEYRIIDLQGTVHWIHARSYPIRNADGKLERIAGIVEDITQRKQTEQHLQERTTELKVSRDFIEAVIDIVGAVIIVTDSKGKIVRFNHACEHVSGYSVEEAMGHEFWDFLLLPEERAGVKDAFLLLSAGQFPSHYENYWLHKDGSKRLIAWSNTCLTNQDGKVEYVIGTGVDVTEQRRAEEALQHSADKYRALIENANEAVLLADLKGNLIEANSRGLNLLGYGREEFISLTVADIHPQHQIGRIMQAFNKMVETGSAVLNDTFLLTHDKREIPIDINANLIEYQGRKVAVGFMRDVTERRRLEQTRLEQERRHREMLVREVHHRIKNNLQGVIGLLRISDEEEKYDEQLLTRVIGQINTIAMVHGLQSRFSDNEIRLCDITRAIVDQLRSIAPADVHVEFYENIRCPAILREEETIPVALVINEIITNAVKHIPASCQNKQVIVEIKGSPAEGMELLIFNSGARLPKDLNTQARNQSGVGLDLIHALLPKQYTHFSLADDPVADGVFARLCIESGILGEICEPLTTAQTDDSLKQPTTPD
jgi:PAS domain S-box-containing protein